MQLQKGRLTVKNSDLKKFLQDKTVIIFGAGSTGKVAFKLLQHENIPVAAFYDNGALKPYSVENIPVSRMNFSSLDPSKVVFILSFHNIDEAIKQLADNGGFNWIPAYEFLNEESRKILSYKEFQKIESVKFYYEKFMNKNFFVLDSLDFVITERCSLRCKECSNLMQYYSAPKNFSVETLKKEIDLVASVFDEIYDVRLIGGEPFVNPHWAEILQYISSKENIKRINIYTNATILPTDSQCEILQASNKVCLSISDYGELSRNLNPLQNKLDSYAIPYEVKEIISWTRCSSFEKHNRTSEELRDVFEKCCAKNLATLLQGKFYPCPFISNAMNLCAIPQDKNDYVDLTEPVDIEILRQKVQRLMNRPFFNSCEWCAGRPNAENIKEEDLILPHEQANKPVPYKKYLGNNYKERKLTVIVPVYNVENYLKRCIDSIRNQTFQDFSLILVDDGSTDNSLAICEECAKIDDRITVIHQENQGPAAARNRGLELIRGGQTDQYLTFIDSDDWIEPQTFENFIDFMDANPEVDVCSCNGFVDNTTGAQIVLFPNDNDYEILDLESIMKRWSVPHFAELWAKMSRRSITQNFKLDETLHMGETPLGTWQLFKKSRKIGVIPYKGYHFFVGNPGLSFTNNFETMRYPYDDLRYALMIYQEREINPVIKWVFTQHLINISIWKLVRLLIQDKFEVKADDVEPYLKILAENKDEILNTVELTPPKIKVIDILAQPFDKARDGCRKIFTEFMNELKNFYATYHNIFIYGTGYFGIEVAGWLNNMNCTQYRFLTSKLNADSSRRLEISGAEKEIIDLPNFSNDPNDAGIILAMNERNAKDVSAILQDKDYKNIFDANKLGIHL